MDEGGALHHWLAGILRICEQHRVYRPSLLPRRMQFVRLPQVSGEFLARAEQHHLIGMASFGGLQWPGRRRPFQTFQGTPLLQALGGKKGTWPF